MMNHCYRLRVIWEQCQKGSNSHLKVVWWLLIRMECSPRDWIINTVDTFTDESTCIALPLRLLFYGSVNKFRITGQILCTLSWGDDHILLCCHRSQRSIRFRKSRYLFLKKIWLCVWYLTHDSICFCFYVLEQGNACTMKDTLHLG